MLNLNDCERFVGLPNNFGMSVPKLKTLRMGGCSNLKTLPNSIGLLANLVDLDLDDCKSLTCLWENHAKIQVKELLFCQWIGDNKTYLDLLLSFPTL